MLVIAHRGASAEHKENSLAAFERAVAVGADMIELDLRVSQDGVVFVAHDRVRDPSWRRPRPFPPRLPWQRVRAIGEADGLYLSLAELLDRFVGRIALNLELKERRAAALVAGELLARELLERGEPKGILLSSFDRRTMRILRALAPAVPRALLVPRIPRRLGSALASIGASTLHLRHDRLRPRTVELAHRAGVPIYVWTVDDEAEIRRLVAWGVDGVFTNDPGRTRAVLGS